MNPVRRVTVLGRGLSVRVWVETIIIETCRDYYYYSGEESRMFVSFEERWFDESDDNCKVLSLVCRQSFALT